MDKLQPSAKKENETPAKDQQAVDNWEGRPVIKMYKSGNKFCVTDKVYISEGRALQGPFLIASVPSTGKYTLSKEDGTRVEDGKIYEENKLESVN